MRSGSAPVLVSKGLEWPTRHSTAGKQHLGDNVETNRAHECIRVVGYRSTEVPGYQGDNLTPKTNLPTSRLVFRLLSNTRKSNQPIFGNRTAEKS